MSPVSLKKFPYVVDLSIWSISLLLLDDDDDDDDDRRRTGGVVALEGPGTGLLLLWRCLPIFLSHFLNPRHTGREGAVDQPGARLPLLWWWFTLPIFLSCFLKIRSCGTVRNLWFICWRICKRIPSRVFITLKQCPHICLQRQDWVCSFKLLVLAKLLLQSQHLWTGIHSTSLCCVWAAVMCILRVPFKPNVLLHMGQSYFAALLTSLKCLVK